MNARKIGKFTRISKATARKRYINGETVYTCPVNLNPSSPWGTVTSIPKSDSDLESAFEYHVTCLTFHTCINSETGKYLAFYEMEE